MKKAISAWSFAGTDFLANVRLARAAGFEGMEAALDRTGAIRPDSSDEELRELGRRAAGEGVILHSLACTLCWENSFAADDPGERLRALEIARSQIHAARALGATSVLLVPGSVHTPLRPGVAPVPYGRAFERSFAAFSELKEVAEAEGIDIGIENVWNKIFLSPLELRDFVDSLGSPRIGVYFDVGNVLAFGFPEDWIRVLGRRIKKVHLKDYRSETTGFAGFVDLLAGEVNWPEVMAALRETGYDGWCTAEMLPPYRFCPERILHNTSAAMSDIFSL